MSNIHNIDKQFANVIHNVRSTFAQSKMGRGSIHDVPRAMHLAILLAGRRSVGNVVGNAVNVRDAFRGPRWTRAQGNSDDRSLHAEARAAVRALPKSVTNRKRKRKALRQSVGAADGVLVCRLNSAGRLCNSMPCSHCVDILARCGFRFVVFSTGDEARPWCKMSLSRLLVDERVQPVRRLR
jgi:hypothetical protein